MKICHLMSTAFGFIGTANNGLNIKYVFVAPLIQGCRAVENSLNEMRAHQTLKRFIVEKD